MSFPDAAATETTAAEPVRLLLVDDDELDRAAVRRSLRASGLAAEVAEVDDSQAALAALATAPFDCMLLDYRLPGTDGLAVLRAVRAAGYRLPIIMMTGQGDEQLAVEIMKAGATDYLAKGRVSADALAASVRSALRIHRSETLAANAETHRRHAEAALRQNERLLAITLRSIGDAVIATDARGCVTFLNSVAETLTGWIALDAIGQRFENVLPLARGGSGPAIESPVERVFRTGAPVELEAETHAETRAGRRFPVASSGAPIRDDLGATVGVVVVFRDTTERVRSEGRLRFLAALGELLAASLDERANLRSLARLAVPHLGDWCAIDLATSEGGLERVAIAADPEREAIEAELMRRYPLDPQAAHGPARVIRTGQAEYCPETALELPGSMPDGQQELMVAVGLRSYLSVPLSGRGRTIGAITVGRLTPDAFSTDDIGLAQEAARRTALALDNGLLYREAQEAIQARDTFLSIAAHELKTPLTSLLGYADLLQRRIARGEPVGDRELRMLRVTADQARRLNKMVASLLDLSRLQMGQLSIERRPVDLPALVTRIAEEIEPTLERHTLHLSLPDAPLLALGDELRLEQVLQNLVQNAVKYSPDGGPVRIELAQQGVLARLSVSDKGLGIPAEAMQRIFTRFFRAPNSEERQISGLGVGLYVVRQIVELHGGRVEVESAEQAGSTFTVWLPIE
jgi:PAS domain S-box-containing protein